jgi:AmmeMemoRadiSam system protein B/AmmeMemoRadiSam system protein A
MLSRAAGSAAEGNILALVAPHAGYPYSGQTAADAYRQVGGIDYEATVVLAPSHREVCGGAAVFPGEGYETPLGVVAVHRPLAEAIAARAVCTSVSSAGHDVDALPAGPIRGEHAVEVQLPFLQVALPGVPVVPVVMDTHDLEACRSVADAIVGACSGRKVLLVASSGLYHGHDHDACVASDERTLAEICSLDPTRLSDVLVDGRAQACGAGPILAVMIAAQRLGATEARLISRTTSADASEVSGGYVVGYGAVAFLSTSDQSSDEHLTERDREVLAQIARDAIRASVTGQRPATPSPTTAATSRAGRAFVTIYRNGNLRGCIGDLQGTDPLGTVVEKMAAAAALRDPRFPPISAKELPGLQVEISVIGPFRTIGGQSDIQIGRDGLWIRRGVDQGVLLPKVAVDFGWDAAEFLEHTCQKAHLPPDAWRDPETVIQAFQADVFSA